MLPALIPAIAGSIGMRVGLPAVAGRFSSSKILSSMKMGFGYTSSSYLMYGFLNEKWDPLSVQPKWDMRGGALKSKLPFRKRRKKMAFGYRRRFYRRPYSRFRRRSYYRRRYY